MAVYYVTAAASGGGAGTIGDPYTLAEARAAVIAGDKVFVKADADYTTQDGASGSILHLSVTGTFANPITFEGYTTTPGDGGQVTFDTGTAGLTRGVGASGSTINHYILKNIICTGGSQGFNGANGACDNWTLINCQADTCSIMGYWLDTSCNYIKCAALNNGRDYDSGSFSVAIASYGANSSDYTFYSNGMFVLYGCYAYGMTNEGVDANPAMAFNCAWDGDNGVTSKGIYNNSIIDYAIILNNIFFDLNIGIDTLLASGATSDSDSICLFDWNLFFSNTTDVQGTTPNSYGDVTGTGDPFTDSANRDYTLASGSEAIDAGVDMNTTGPFV